MVEAALYSGLELGKPWLPTPALGSATRAQERLFLDYMSGLERAASSAGSRWDFLESERSALKAHVCASVAAAAGSPVVDEDVVSAWLADWALDSPPMLTRGYKPWLPGAPFEPGDPYGAKAAMALATYSLTQRLLAEAGVSELHVFRGMSWPPGGEPPWVKGLDPGRAHEALAALRDESSFSADPSVALAFAWERSSEGTGAVLAATIPARRVLSLPMTGPGCFPEAEVVVLGGDLPCAIFPVILREPQYDATLRASMEADVPSWRPFPRGWGWTSAHVN